MAIAHSMCSRADDTIFQRFGAAAYFATGRTTGRFSAGRGTMETIKGIVKLVGECIAVLALLVAYAIVKVLYWGVMGIKFLLMALW